MKYNYLSMMGLAYCFFLVFLGCDSARPVGSEDVMVLHGAEFQIDTLYTSNTRFYVEGKVTNDGGSPFYPYWYIEADFYENATSNLKFGGSSTTMSFKLEPDEQTFFDLDFSSNNIIESEYPNFDVRNLRAYINN